MHRWKGDRIVLDLRSERRRRMISDLAAWGVAILGTAALAYAGYMAACALFVVGAR